MSKEWPAGQRAEAITDAILASVRAGDDLGDMLSLALGHAADQLGSVEALVAGRPGSWEADHVRALAVQYAGTPDGLMRPATPSDQEEGGSTSPPG